MQFSAFYSLFFLPTFRRLTVSIITNKFFEGGEINDGQRFRFINGIYEGVAVPRLWEVNSNYQSFGFWLCLIGPFPRFFGFLDYIKISISLTSKKNKVESFGL